MTKLLLIISLLALLGSAGIGVVNRQNLIKTRADKDKANADTQGLLTGKVEELISENKAKTEDFKKEERAYEEAAATLSITQSNLVTAKREIDVEKAKESPLDEEIQKFNDLLKRLQDEFPGMKAADIAAKIEELNAKKKALGAEEEALLAEVEVLSKKVEANLAEVDRREENQEKRSLGIARNVMQATITAVNQDWGFVVFNAGENMGVTLDSKLYIKRGTQVMGRLKPISVESRLTVANIDVKTVPKGGVVLPGDKVILGTVQD